MSELQYAILAMTLTALILAVIYLGWRVKNLQDQNDELRHMVLRMRVTILERIM